MSNVQNKIGTGLSMIQDGLDKNKNKMDSMKEIAKHNKIIEDIQNKKVELLLEIGLMTYQKIRTGDISDKEINEKCKSIVGFDYIIYENQKSIYEIKNSTDGTMCECGAKVSSEDKFCSGCGNKVEIEEDTTQYANCTNCEMSIPSDVRYCPCCGCKNEFDFSSFQI